MENLDNNINSTEETKYTFLRVLCYLSMFANGSNAFRSASSAITLKNPDEVYQLNLQFNETLASIQEFYPEEVLLLMRNFYEIYLLNIVNISAVDFVAHVIGFMGAFFMNKFMKKGFYLYVASQLVLVVNLYLFLPMNMLGTVWVIWQVFIGAIFTIMYATQFKKLVNA